MKRLLLLLPLLAVNCFAAGTPTATNNVTLSWDRYPTNMITPDLIIKIYWQTNISTPIAQWTLLTNVSPTNVSCVLKVDMIQQYFFLSPSNFWGEANPSNVVLTPPAPQDGLNLKIARGP